MMPASTLETKTVCGTEEHSHDSSCYEATLVCGQEEDSTHVHDESCYEETLVCGLTEHTHTDACYASDDEATEDGEESEDSDATTLTAAALPDGAEVPEGYTEQYTVQDEENGYTVTVYAAEDVVPAGATLSATLLSEDTDEYASAEEALAAEADDDDEYGFAALDIHFEDADGNEVEPAGNVYVVIDAQGLLPEDADADTVTVQHHAESDGDVTVETVADAADATDGVVAVTDDTTVQAAFSVESFSTFTISWSSGSGQNATTYFTVTVHYVDVNGNEIQGTRTEAISTNNVSNNGTTYTFSTYVGTISGYTYSGTYYGSVNGSEVASMTFSQTTSSSGGQGGRPDQGQTTTTRTLTFSNNSETVATLTYDSSTLTANVYLVYEPEGLYIRDYVSSTGNYTVVYNGEEEIDLDDYTFVWYRDNGESESDTAYPTSEDDWTEVTRTRVSGSLYNLSDDYRSLNVALDAEYMSASGSQRFWYKVEVKDSNGTTVTTLYQKSAYYYELQNGGFESPDIEDGQHNTTDSDTEVIWKTTDTNSAIELIQPWGARSGQQGNYSYTGTYGTHGVNDAPESDQIVELNADSEGTLYQDVLTVPGSTLNWQLQHRARNYGNGVWYSGYDTMYVVIMAEEDAAAITSQTQVRNLVAQATYTDSNGNTGNFSVTEYVTTVGMVEGQITDNDGNVIAKVWRITDYTNGENDDPGADSWTKYISTYTVPDDQYLTRFFFVSGATGFANRYPNSNLAYTVGNLLDDVAFTTRILDPDDGEATLSVTKTVSGLDDDDWEGYAVTFDVTDSSGENLGTITISNFTANEDGTYSGTGTLTIELGTNETSKAVTITERSPSVNGYTVTTTVSGSATADSSDSLKATATLSDGSTTSVTYTNTYSKDTESVTIKKTDSDGQTTLEGASFQLYYTVETTVSGDNGEEVATETKYYYQEVTTTENGETVTTVEWISEGEITDTNQPTTLTSSETDGTLTFLKLDTSKTYYLVETKAPDGYQLLEKAIVISWTSGTLTATEQGGSTSLVGTDPETGASYIQVKNQTGAELPSTGGSGTTYLTISGLLLVAIAVGGGFATKRLRRRGGAFGR